MAERAYPGGGVRPGPSVRFGPFELALHGGELRKEGRKIRLQEQPFQILRILLESPGEVVSREEIRRRLWPDNTVVEFDHSINAAVKRLRDALRDSADKPRYIETLARRGYRFIGEVQAADPPALAEPIAAVPEPAVVAEPPPAHARPYVRHRWILVLALFASAVLIVWAGTGYYRRRPPSPALTLQPLIRLDVDLGSEASSTDRPGAGAILSPDGTRLVFVTRSKLVTRRLDEAKATELPGTDRAQAPFFSPDGQWVAFSIGSKLEKISVHGGPVIDLADAPLVGTGSWGDDGNIVASFSFRLSRIPAGGGTPTLVTDLAPGEIVHRWPQVLPGARAMLFTAYRSMFGLDGATIEALSLKDGRRRTLVRGGTWGRYLASGHLVYLDKGTLFAIPFDPDRLEVHGNPTPVLEEVAYSAATGAAQIDFSRAGALVYRSSKAGTGLVTVQWLDNAGVTGPLLPVPGNYLSPTLSPDGKRLALTSAGDIWVYEMGRGAMTQLTYGGGYGNPLWTADGRFIVFRAAQGMWWARADGTGQPQPLTASATQQVPWSFTGDGRRLAFVEPIAPSGAAGAHIWTVTVESGSGLKAGKPEIFLPTSYNKRCPMFSPDGHWLAYQSDESGRSQVWVQAFPDGHGKQQISTEGGAYPSWSRDGHELFFWQVGPHGQLMVAPCQERGDSLVVDAPRAWPGNKPAVFSTTRSYDPAPDGKSVVALMPAEASQGAQTRVVFLMNFFDELRRRAPLR